MTRTPLQRRGLCTWVKSRITSSYREIRSRCYHSLTSVEEGDLLYNKTPFEAISFALYKKLCNSNILKIIVKLYLYDLYGLKPKKVEKINFYFIKVFSWKILNRISNFVCSTLSFNQYLKSFKVLLHNAQYSEVTTQESSFPFNAVSFFTLINSWGFTSLKLVIFHYSITISQLRMFILALNEFVTCEIVKAL